MNEMLAGAIIGALAGIAGRTFGCSLKNDALGWATVFFLLWLSGLSIFLVKLITK